MEMEYGCISRFIGRHEEREQIKQVIVTTDVQLLQIYGLPSVGKTELVRQVCQELSTEVEIQTVYRRVTNSSLLNSEICCLLPNFRTSKTLSVIVFDAFEKLSNIEEFNEFCLENMWNAPRLKIIVIFQGFFPLQLEGFSDERILVKPMNEKDARCLFYRRAKLVLNEDSDTQVDELVNLCGALPGQIIELTNKISQFPPNTTLTDVYNYVKDNKTFCQSEDIFAKLDRYVKKLPPDQCHTYSEMVYFPGTFSVDDVTNMSTSYKDDLNTKFKFLYPLLGSGLLKTMDEDNGQYQIPALFQDYANQQLSHLRHEDTTKLKFSAIIGKTLIEAERLWEMGLSYEALGIMKDKWTNVQKLLTQAIHSPSDGNSFQIYYKVAVDSSNIMSVCYPNESRLFCKAVFNNAQIFGSEDQQAISMACYGHTLADSSQEEALQLYKKAEGILRGFNHSYQFIILLYNMSKVYYQSGQLQKGIRCAEEALSIQVADHDAADVQHVKTYAASYLAYNLIFATEYNKAEMILKRTLQEVGESGHPTVPTMLNSLGLKEERSKGDLNRALTFYFASLSKKRKIAKFQEPLLVTTLCNVAGQLSKTKHKHDFALSFLYEAEGIRKRAGWVHSYSALVVWNIGMVYMRKRMQVDALMKITEAEQLYGAVNREHYVNAEVKIWLAHCHLLLDNAEEAKRLFLEIVRNREMYQKNRPQGEFVLNAFEHLIRLSIQDSSEQQSYLQEVLKELPRLNKSPGVSPISSKIYRQLLIEYMELLLKIADNNEKSEPRSGLFLERIPQTCLACQEVYNYAMCPRDIYLQKLSSLTTPCELFNQSNNSITVSVSCQSETFQLRQSEMSSPVSICHTPNVVGCLTSTVSDESLNSMNLPLPVKELCKSQANLLSVHNDAMHTEDIYLQKQNLSTLIHRPFDNNDIEKSPIGRGQMPKLELLMSSCKPFDQTNDTARVVPCEQKMFQQKQSERLSPPNIPNASNQSKNNVGPLKFGCSDESLNSMNLPLPVKELCKSQANLLSVHNDAMHTKDIYLQKHNLPTLIHRPFDNNSIEKSPIGRGQMPKLELLMSSCKPFDQTNNDTARVVPCEQKMFQQKQSERLSPPNIPNASNQSKNNVGPLKFGRSDESLNSMNLPLPVKELCKSQANLELVNHCHKDMSQKLPDFSALLSLEGPDENNRIETVAVTKVQQHNISEDDQTKDFPKTIFTNSAEKSVKLLERNGNILENKQSWKMKNLIKEPQNGKYQELYFQDNPGNTQNMNTNTNMFGFSLTVNDPGINKLPNTQRDTSGSEKKPKEIFSAKQTPNIHRQNEFKENHSKFPFQNISPANMLPTRDSFNNFYQHNQQNGHCFHSNQQSNTHTPIQMSKYSKQFLEHDTSSQHLDRFKNNNSVSKVTDFHPNLSTSYSQPNWLNADSYRQQIFPNRCSANTNINNNSPINQNIISDSVFAMNNLSQSLQISGRFRSREPVQHEEKND